MNIVTQNMVYYINNDFLLFFGISPGEILIILLIVLLLFGPKKIPEIARTLGRGFNELKKAQQDINSEIKDYTEDVTEETKEFEKNIKSATKINFQDDPSDESDGNKADSDNKQDENNNKDNSSNKENISKRLKA